MSDTFNKVQNLLSEMLGLDIADIKADSGLKGLEGDSFTWVEVTLQVEEEFDIDIPDEDIDQIKTVQDIVDYVDKKTAS